MLILLPPDYLTILVACQYCLRFAPCPDSAPSIVESIIVTGRYGMVSEMCVCACAHASVYELLHDVFSIEYIASDCRIIGEL
jgi:hypothetical protein